MGTRILILLVVSVGTLISAENAQQKEQWNGYDHGESAIHGE